jgi:uncharacterized protein YjbI with pentapeptide repeats
MFMLWRVPFCILAAFALATAQDQEHGMAYTPDTKNSVVNGHSISDWNRILRTKTPEERASILRSFKRQEFSIEGVRMKFALAAGLDLSGIDLVAMDLKNANLSGANLSGAYLIEADLSGTDLSGADLREAKLAGAKLFGADLSHAKLGGTMFVGAMSSRRRRTRYAVILSADLTNADLSGTDLKDASLYRVNLAGTIFEPAVLPSPQSISQAVGLGYLRFNRDSGPIFELRKRLADAGFRDAVRQVTASIRRNGQGRLERLVFDFTCEWGANWLRPFLIIGVLSLVCTAVYWIGMHFGSSGINSGLFLVSTGQRVPTSKGKERVIRVSSVSACRRKAQPVGDSRWQYVWRRLRREQRALRTAFLFSLMSVFNIGFSGFDFGRWIRLLQPREYDVRARGWMRSLSGAQSLVGVALVALSILSYFGHPFE